MTFQGSNYSHYLWIPVFTSTCREARRNGDPIGAVGAVRPPLKRRPLAERPQAAADRQTPGHWEADLALRQGVTWIGRLPPSLHRQTVTTAASP